LSIISDKTYVSGIDGLRAVAVLSVMIYHLKVGVLLGGFVGVDVFFVISGFVVTLSIYKKRFVSLTTLFAYFYSRRLTRIAPALVAMLSITSLLTVAFVPYAWLSDANRTTAFYAFFGLSNIQLAQTADDYFGPRTDFNPFAHTWSLGVEEQFYFIFPILIGAVVLGWSKRGAAFALVLVIALSIISFAVCVHFSARDPVFSFFQIPTRFWELGLGAALALSIEQWSRRVETWGRSTLNFIGAAALIVLLASFVLCDEEQFPFPWALPPVAASTVLICIVFSQRPTWASKLLSARILTVIGLLSYSLYLWHWPIYVLLRWTTGLDTIGQQVLALLATFTAAAISYQIIEQPFRTSAFLSRIARPTAVALLSFALFCGAAISRTVFHYNSTLTLSVTKNAPVWSPYDLRLPEGRCTIATSTRDVSSVSVTSLSAHCSQDSLRRIFVAGDSHASAYTRLLATLSSQEGYSVTLYTRLGCPFLDFRTSINEMLPHCAEFTRLTEASILNDARPGDFVFLPSLRIDRYRNQWGGEIQNTALKATHGKSAAFEARTFIMSLSLRGVHVVIEAPTPVFKSPPFRCSDWFNRANPVCDAGFSVSRKEMERRRSEVVQIAMAMTVAIPSVVLWDPLPILCSQQRCSAFDQSGPLFFDGDHLSGYGNDILYRSFAETLRKYSETEFK
jgi:peptidoglycan/LPS O-acetylase OafA/YrhL